MYSNSGGTAVSLSSAAMGVLLYAPAILRRHLFWTSTSGCRRAVAAPLPVSVLLYTCAPYIIIRRTTAIYRSLDRLINGPYMEFASRASELNVVYLCSTVI